MSQPSEFELAIKRLEEDSPQLANALIPSGATKQLIMAMDIGPSVWDRTPFSRAEDLPKKIELKHDFRLTANILKASSEFEVYSKIISLSRLSGAPTVLNAPDLSTALSVLVPEVNKENPPLKLVPADVDPDTVGIKVFANTRLGPIARIWENLVTLWLLRTIVSFTEFYINQLQSAAPIKLYLRCDTSEFANQLSQQFRNVRLGTATDTAMVSFARAFLSAPNPDFDEHVWSFSKSASNPSHSRSTGILSLIELELEVLDSIRSKGRAPQLPELARSIGISTRTLNRRLANNGVTLNEITSRVRRSLAEELLRNSALSVKEVSSAVGYANASSFIRAFRLWNGVAPDKWRKPNTHP